MPQLRWNNLKTPPRVSQAWRNIDVEVKAGLCTGVVVEDIRRVLDRFK